jgi:DNA-binding NtrC family response regulator
MLPAQRILIIEDEPMIALDLKLALAEAGADVVGIASTIDEARELAEAPDITGAVVDLRLHGQSVRGVAQRLTERAIPFLFYSGHDEAPTARSWPAVPLLTKPQAPAAILEMLAQMIAARADAAKRALPPKT